MAIRTKADEYTQLITLALEDAAEYTMSTIFQRTGSQYLCTFQGFNYVHEVLTNGINTLTLLVKRRTPAKVRYITIGKPGRQETLFGSFCDDTVRAFSMEADSLTELAQIKLVGPWQVLWDSQRSQLIIADWDYDKLSDKIICMTVSNDRKEFELKETALDAGTWIIAWDQIDEHGLVCFDFYKRELIRYTITSF